MSSEPPVPPGRAAQIIGLIDLTDLSDGCTSADVAGLCERAATHRTAAVCVWPDFVAQARAALAGSPVRVATVVDFPTGDERAHAVGVVTERAIDDGAHEIDVVLPYRAFMAGDLDRAAAVVRTVRRVAHGALVKVILETGELLDARLIEHAARLAIDEGADFLKTSTGTSPVSATHDAVAVLVDVIADAGRTVGLKASGGIRTAADADAYLAEAEARLGADWPTPATFRFGASALLEVLI